MLDAHNSRGSTGKLLNKRANPRFGRRADARELIFYLPCSMTGLLPVAPLAAVTFFRAGSLGEEYLLMNETNAG